MTDDVRALRAAFPAFEGGLCFLDWAATGLVPEGTRRAIHAYVDDLARCDGAVSTWIHERHGATRQQVRAAVAARIGASHRDVALMESTTAGLNAAAAATRMPKGANVVLSAIDYLAVATPWKQRQRLDGLELRWVPPRGGTIEAADLLERIDEKTRVVSLSTLCWTTGALVDIDAIARETRQRGIVLVLDAVQTFGVVPLDVRRTPASYVACGGHKWLCSPLGAGFLYVNPETAARAQPVSVGFLSGRPPRGTWAEWFADPEARPDEEVLFPSAARIFETGGTPSYPGAIGLLEALSLLGTGGDEVLARVRGLGTRLIAGLDARGLEVVTPREAERRAGVVVFHVPGGVEAEKAEVERLKERRVVAGVRYCGGLGGVRVSLHAMNTDEDVDRLLESL